MADDRQELAALRAQIDQLDHQLMDLISQRARCAQAIAQVKLAADPNAVFYRPEREAQVLRQVMENNSGPLPDTVMATLFREIMSACLSLEAPVQVVYLDDAQQQAVHAVLKHFGRFAYGIQQSSAEALWQSLLDGSAQYGLVSEQQFIHHTVGQGGGFRFEEGLFVCGEVLLPAEDPADIHRFFVLGGRRLPASGDDRTCLLIEHVQSQQPLVQLQACLHQFSFNLLASGAGDGKTLVYLSGHHEEPLFTAMLNQLAQCQVDFQVLGSYPSGW